MPPTRPDPEEQERLYRAIADAMWKSVPDEWEEITLRIEATRIASCPVTLELIGPAGVSNRRVPVDSLYEPTLELYDLFARDAYQFSRCDFLLTWDADREIWKFKVDYIYPQEA